MNGRKLANGLFYLLLIAFLVISFNATFYGLKPTLDFLAGFGTVGIIIALFGSTMMIHWLRRSSPDASILGPVAMLGLALIVSTASNVNFFYTTYLQRDLSRNAVESALESFKIDIEDAKKTLRADDKLAQVIGFRAEIERLLGNLREQMLDPLNPGFGAKSAAIMAEIKQKLPSVTELALPASRRKEDLLGWYGRYEKVVRDNLGATVSDQQKDYLALVRDMDADYASYTLAAETLKREGNAALIRDAHEAMARKLTEYQASVNRLLTMSSRSWTPPRPIDPEANRIGDIVRTWGSVFKGEGDPRALFWTIVASLIIDLFPLFYSLWVVKRPLPGEYDGVVVT